VAHNLDAQIAELRQVHEGLTKASGKEYEIILSGPLPFEVSADGRSPITDSFEIELIIPDVYP